MAPFGWRVELKHQESHATHLSKKFGALSALDQCWMAHCPAPSPARISGGGGVSLRGVFPCLPAGPYAAVLPVTAVDVSPEPHPLPCPPWGSSPRIKISAHRDRTEVFRAHLCRRRGAVWPLARSPPKWPKHAPNPSPVPWWILPRFEFSMNKPSSSPMLFSFGSSLLLQQRWKPLLVKC